MAAMFNKHVLFVAAFFVPLVSVGCASLTVSSGGAFDISLNRYESEKNQLESAIKRCDEKRDVVPALLISPLKMTVNEVKTALFVLNSRAEEACEGDARLRFFYASGVHRQVAKHYGLSAGDAEDYTEDLMFSQDWKKLEFEAQYLDIDENIRHKLEAIEELKVPFMVFETIDGLYQK